MMSRRGGAPSFSLLCRTPLCFDPDWVSLEQKQSIFIFMFPGPNSESWLIEVLNKCLVLSYLFKLYFYCLQDYRCPHSPPSLCPLPSSPHPCLYVLWLVPSLSFIHCPLPLWQLSVCSMYPFLCSLDSTYKWGGYIVSFFRASKFLWIFLPRNISCQSIVLIHLWLLRPLFWSTWSSVSFFLPKCSSEMRIYFKASFMLQHWRVGIEIEPGLRTLRLEQETVRMLLLLFHFHKFSYF